jgi:hypothetical protein
MIKIFSTYLLNSLGTKKGAAITSSILFCVVLLTTYPIYLERLGSASDDSFFFRKIESPFDQGIVSKDTHGSKTAFRLTVPLLAKILNLGYSEDARKVVALYLIQSFLLLPFFYVLTRLLREYLDNFQTLLVAISCSSVYVTKAFFWDIDFWFDGVAYFLLMLGMFLRNRPGIFCALTLACWTDERAVVALSSVYLFHLLRENDYELDHLRQIFNKDFFRKGSFVPVFAGCCYLVIRTVLAAKFSLHTPYGDGTGLNVNLIPQQFSNSLAGIFLTFEGLWLFFLMAMLHAYTQRKFLVIYLFSSLMLIHIMVAYSVLDVTRSLTYAFPIFIVAAIFVGKNITESKKNIFLLATLLCIFIPTQFMIGCPLQIPWLIFSFGKLGPVMHLFLQVIHF